MPPHGSPYRPDADLRLRLGPMDGRLVGTVLIKRGQVKTAPKCRRDFGNISMMPKGSPEGSPKSSRVQTIKQVQQRFRPDMTEGLPTILKRSIDANKTPSQKTKAKIEVQRCCIAIESFRLHESPFYHHGSALLDRNLSAGAVLPYLNCGMFSIGGIDPPPSRVRLHCIRYLPRLL